MAPIKRWRTYRARWMCAERRARWALVRPLRMPRESTRTATRGRPARPARVTIADDGTRTAQGKDACLWLELDGVQLHSLPGELLDAFTIRAVEDWHHLGLDLDAAAMLLIESDLPGEAANTELDRAVFAITS